MMAIHNIGFMPKDPAGWLVWAACWLVFWLIMWKLAHDE